MWKVTFSWAGMAPETHEVGGENMAEAVIEALEEVGLDANDEGRVTIEVSGAAD